MTKRTRLIILLICGVLFFVIAPWIVLYSLGYRIDFANKKLVATGGIYVRVIPQSVQVTIDDQINKTGIFSNSVFVQNLLPKQHTVTITKDSYIDYNKSLEVTGNNVTKLENVVLFKKDIPFNFLQSDISYISLAPNQTTLLATKVQGDITNVIITNLQTNQNKIFAITTKGATIENVIWSEDSSRIIIETSVANYVANLSLTSPVATTPTYLAGATNISFNPQNSSEIYYTKNNDLLINSQPTILLKNVVAYKKNGTTITWLSTDELLYSYDTNSSLNTALTLQPFTTTSTNYTMKLFGDMVILETDSALFALNTKTHALETVYSPVTTAKTSPDNQKLLYCNDHEITYSFMNTLHEKVLLNRFADQVKDCDWLNNDYVIFSVGNNVVISEIDVRGQINTATLPQHADTLLYSQQDKKAYILSQNNVVVSERLLP